MSGKAAAAAGGGTPVESDNLFEIFSGVTPANIKEFIENSSSGKSKDFSKVNFRDLTETSNPTTQCNKTIGKVHCKSDCWICGFPIYMDENGNSANKIGFCDGSDTHDCFKGLDTSAGAGGGTGAGGGGGGSSKKSTLLKKKKGGVDRQGWKTPRMWKQIDGWENNGKIPGTKKAGGSSEKTYAYYLWPNCEHIYPVLHAIYLFGEIYNANTSEEQIKMLGEHEYCQSHALCNGIKSNNMWVKTLNSDGTIEVSDQLEKDLMRIKISVRTKCEPLRIKISGDTSWLKRRKEIITKKLQESLKPYVNFVRANQGARGLITLSSTAGISRAMKDKIDGLDTKEDSITVLKRQISASDTDLMTQAIHQSLIQIKAEPLRDFRFGKVLDDIKDVLFDIKGWDGTKKTLNVCDIELAEKLFDLTKITRFGRISKPLFDPDLKNEDGNNDKVENKFNELVDAAGSSLKIDAMIKYVIKIIKIDINVKNDFGIKDLIITTLFQMSALLFVLNEMKKMCETVDGGIINMLNGRVQEIHGLLMSELTSRDITDTAAENIVCKSLIQLVDNFEQFQELFIKNGFYRTINYEAFKYSKVFDDSISVASDSASASGGSSPLGAASASGGSSPLYPLSQTSSVKQGAEDLAELKQELTRQQSFTPKKQGRGREGSEALQRTLSVFDNAIVEYAVRHISTRVTPGTSVASSSDTGSQDTDSNGSDSGGGSVKRRRLLFGETSTTKNNIKIATDVSGQQQKTI